LRDRKARHNKETRRDSNGYVRAKSRRFSGSLPFPSQGAGKNGRNDETKKKLELGLHDENLPRDWTTGFDSILVHGD
jgi:hypothetical protein